jgi:NDP-sugar pyrophosphorylase family protein
MKVVIPMSGMSRRFMDAGYTVPKYLLEIDGKTVIEHIIDLYPKDTEFVCILNRKHHDETDVAGLLLHKLPEGSSIRVIDPHKLGPVHSVLQALKDIDDEEQVIVNYCDFSMNWDYDDFKSHVDDTQCDGCVVSYTGFHPHMLGSDNYAFCRLRMGSYQIEEIREKRPFTDDKMSEFASTGTYYFKKGKYVKYYFQKLIDEDVNINGEYYVSLVHNLMIKDGLYNTVYEVPNMLQWGTPLDVKMYQQWSDYYRAVMEGNKPLKIKNCVTALPMAGAGSRFSKEGFGIPKPFIEINGQYMVDQAKHCLPTTDETIYACLNSHMSMLPLDDFGNVVWIDGVLEGQACTTERIINEVDDDTSILLSACDNGALYDSDKFADLIEDQNNDIVVWSYRNNYTAYRNPNMYSWLDVDESGNVTKVNVKNFTGTNPTDEYAIVGTMFFRNKQIYFSSLENLYKKDERTNGEFYVDNLLNEAIDLGYTVKNFEIDHYICWGTPNDLKTYRYWQEFFHKVHWHPYDYGKDYFTN